MNIKKPIDKHKISVFVTFPFYVKNTFLVFKLSPCCSNEKLSSGYFPGVRTL